MAKSVNRAILLGNVGKDPEVRSTAGGAKVANFSLATSERFKDHSGAWQERTEWHNLVAYARVAEIVEKYVHKGSKLYVEGKIETRSWDDRTSGEKKYQTQIKIEELILAGGEPTNNETRSPQPTQSYRSQRESAPDDWDDFR